MISVIGIIVAGLIAAIVFSGFTAFARWMGMTTMSIEKTLGTMFGDGAVATGIGTVLHLTAGVGFALVYAVIFQSLGIVSGWFAGGVIGLVHGLVVGALVMPMVGAVHPAVHAGKMTAPGFFAVNRGQMTPVGLIVAHIVFGTVLGGVYFMFV